MPKKKETVAEISSETREDDSFEKQKADARIKDVSSYRLPEDLDAKLSNWALDDPKFADHVKRAHKMYHTYPGAKGEERWKIEVKMFDYEEGCFNKFGPFYVEDIPTPDDLRAAGAFGRLRLMVHYWIPNKTVKGNHTRPGITTVMSKAFEIMAPPVSVQGPAPARSQIHMQQNSPAMTLPPASFVDAFQAMFTQTQTLMMSAANAQMEILANRQKIVDEGIEKGKLMQLVEIQNRQITELTTAIQALQSRNDDDDDIDYSRPPTSVQNPQATAMSPVLGMLVEKLAPVLLEKFGLNGAVAAVAGAAKEAAASQSGEGSQNS